MESDIYECVNNGTDRWAAVTCSWGDQYIKNIESVYQESSLVSAYCKSAYPKTRAAAVVLWDLCPAAHVRSGPSFMRFPSDLVSMVIWIIIILAYAGNWNNDEADSEPDYLGSDLVSHSRDVTQANYLPSLCVLAHLWDGIIRTSSS